MTENTESNSDLNSPPVNLRVKLAGLWIAAMFCYLYADILAFYDAYLLGEILKGNMGPIGPITQGLKLGIGVLMSIPAIMVVVCYFIKPAVCRWANIIFGVVFTLIIVVTTAMSPFFYYIYFGVVEISITSLIVWLSWRWPSEIDRSLAKPLTSRPM